MDEIKFRAMRAAGIGCFVMLAIIGFFMLASLPPFTGFICYYFWKWVLK